MIKNSITLILIVLNMIACRAQEEEIEKIDVFSQHLKFNEGTVAYGSSLLISNFGTAELNPLGEEGKGYIVKLTNGKIQKFIGPDGYLNSPKGMAIHNDKLYVADVSKVLIYDLSNTAASPSAVLLPDNNLFVNDIAINNGYAYISVTNTGKIFRLKLDTNEISLFMDIPGANGLAFDNNSLYIASYPANGITTDENCIYLIKDINQPMLTKFINQPGQYDGLALYKTKLYYSNWTNGEVGYIDTESGKITTLRMEHIAIQGPADISIVGNNLYIPDLPNSRILQIKL